MATERMEEVEVDACPSCYRPRDPNYALCRNCGYTALGDGAVVPIKSNSLTAARLRLADAAEAWWMANEADHSREWATLLGALAALRTARGEG